jgi:VanZ family protein
LKVFSLQQKIYQWSWLFKIAFYMTIFMGCYMAFTPVEGGIQTKFNDKVLHAVGFFVMAIMAQLAHPKTRFMILSIGLACFGFAIELIQAYLPYRSFSMWDWSADVLGIAVYFIFFAHFLKDKPSLD